MAQAKITVNSAQAARIMLYVHKKKPVYPIMYEPKSGVNLYETKGEEVIEVPDGADLFNLKGLYDAGLFTVVEGKIADVTKFMSVSVAGTMLSLHFDQPVYTTGLTSTTNGAASDDLIVKVNDTAVALTIGAIGKASATKTITVDLGSAPSTSVEVKINATGAAKIKDVGDVAVQPATRTYRV